MRNESLCSAKMQLLTQINFNQNKNRWQDKESVLASMQMNEDTSSPSFVLKNPYQWTSLFLILKKYIYRKMNGATGNESNISDITPASFPALKDQVESVRPWAPLFENMPICPTVWEWKSVANKPTAKEKITPPFLTMWSYTVLNQKPPNIRWVALFQW